MITDAIRGRRGSIDREEGEPEDEEDLIDEGAPEPSSYAFTRRSFIKWGILGAVSAGILGLGTLSTLGYVKRAPASPPVWEIAPGVVDYSKVPFQKLTGPTPNKLRVAQWYDYWPGSFLTDFETYMSNTYGMNVTVDVDIYTSNEELFEWITLGGKTYDVMFPTNHVVDNIKKGGFIYNLNLDWIPNYANMWSDFIQIPHHVNSGDNLDQRLDPRPTGGEQVNVVSVPYFWGTTGIAFLTTKIPKADVEAVGYDFFTMSSYTPTNGGPTVTLDSKMRMLEDQRDVFAAAFKKAGQEWQLSKDIPFSPYTEDYTDSNGASWKGTQWTSNETDTSRVDAIRDWLFRVKPHIFDFNSTQDTPSLIAGTAVLNQAWSGDITYAQRPDQSNPQPADYVVPYQGSRWWQDTCTIHSACRNIWLAHEFINFIHNVDKPWEENQLLARWNLYPTPNRACFDWLALHPFSNGYDMTADDRLYPNLLAPDVWARCDIPRDVGLLALENEYNPLWFELTSV